MVRDYWPQLFAHDTTVDVDAAVSRTMELTEFLATHAAGPIEPARSDVVFHQSCHMSTLLGLINEPIDTLERSGYRATSHAAAGRCCGFGGLFSIKFPELSVAMADDVLDAMVAADATTVTGCDLSCLMQLSSRATFRDIDLDFIHLAELVAGNPAPKDSV
jgi:L-lactate dehydrogenase complex protein LldE